MHQKVIGTQTTNSIFKTKYLYGNNENFKKNRTQNQSIKYTLTFDRKNHYRVDLRTFTLPIYNKYKNSDNEPSVKCTDKNYITTSIDTYSNTEVENILVLKDCLNQNKPEIFKKIEDRKKCIEELKKLR